MDVFSLEDNDCNELFITQSDPKAVDTANESENSASSGVSGGSMLSLLISISLCMRILVMMILKFLHLKHFQVD